ncbi:choice-of-anchor I family protein [Crocosphaera sp. UHCC 0190]|uniref:choice-of-anchor I family protein n=1 Tax=Crocosphaera sp. UHCC 0190 TaxID=3110246 RepID=UPI002B200F00|nr:choice-of-anchor I family protein [Crocosphaera sp. UHCC 0190]MEA5510559.1 choice-of-anchor I family protein [Crocosphaera sp. UHCC 0190]
MPLSLVPNPVKQFTLSIIPATLILGAFGTSVNALDLTRLGSFETGQAQGSEIAAYDPTSQRLFVTNGANNRLDIISISDPRNPTKFGEIDLSLFGGGVNSVAVKNGVVAAAVQANIITDPGTVAFFNVNGNPLNSVTVGALPDMLTFTLDGLKVLVANEGEPNEDYTIDPVGSVSIIDLSNGVLNATVNTAGFSAFNSGNLDPNVRIFGPGASIEQDLEPEYIALSPDGQKAFITLQENNAVATLDLASGTITDIVALGFKDHSLPGNGLDASDRDGPGNNGRINIQNWPVFGMYQPDGISAFQVGNQTYYITANEGDARVRPTGDNILPPPNDGEGDIFNEEVRVNSITLDPTAFPNAAILQDNDNLGRLTITNTLGDTDGDGDFDQLYAFGGRSFSIWDDQGNLVFDSGDDFEQITASLFPSIFNANRDATPDSFDSRSDNKGPEPEGVAIGQIGNRLYGFIGLERIGGFMVYDITDPTNPLFVKYQNDTALGDLSPEGVLFISPEDSPTGQSLLVLTNEESGNTSIYSVSTPEPASILGLMMVGLMGGLSRKFSRKSS